MFGKRIVVQVCYALPTEQVLLPVELDAGASVGQAIERSGILARYPALEMSGLRVGIFGKLKPLDAPVADGDRIEIYRPLKADPKVARQRRVEKVRSAGSREGHKWLAGRR